MSTTKTKRELILLATQSLAIRHGYMNVSRAMVAKKAGVANGTVSYHFVSMGGLYDEVMRLAVERGIREIIAQGLINRHAVALGASDKLRRAAAQFIAQ
jgi:AcrR family transcriptional regulator